MKKYRVATILAVVCSFGAIGVTSSQAESAYFYNATLGGGERVSGVPESSLYFVGAYSTSGNIYCVSDQPTEDPNLNLMYEQCTNGGASVTTSFPSQFGRGQLYAGGTGNYIAEERWG
jgi:hypothetical protein